MNNSGIFGLSSNSSVTINGKTYVGRNITINGNKVRVDGNVVEEAVNIYKERSERCHPFKVELVHLRS